MRLNDMTIADISTNAAKDADRYPADVRNIVIQAFTEGACWAFNHLMKNGHESAYFQQDEIPAPPRPMYKPIQY